MTNLMLITLFGGMALLLYGMQLVGEGLHMAVVGPYRSDKRFGRLLRL